MLIRAFLPLLFVALATSADSKAKELLNVLAKKKFVEKAAFADLAGVILAKTQDYRLRPPEAKAFAKGLENYETLTGKKLNHEGIPFTVREAMPTYIIANRGPKQRTLSVNKTKDYLIFTLCGKLITGEDCASKAAAYAANVEKQGY